MNQQLNIPTIPVQVNVNIDPKQTAFVGVAIFIGVLGALLIFGGLFK